MPSPEDSLAKRVQSSYQQLSITASDLNKVSDELGKSIADLDAALKKLNLGISAWSDIRSSEDDDGSHWSEQVGYAKVGGKWGIALRTVNGNYGWPDQDSEEAWLFNDAPRALRLSAIGKIPILLEELSKEAAKNAQNIKARLAEVQEVATAIKSVAEEPKRAALPIRGQTK